MKTRNWWVGVAAGLVVGLGAVVGVEAATDEASAQGGFSVSAAQLQINQKISQAAVRRSNRSLNYLAPIRTATTDDADDGTNGVTPLADIPGAGEGWTSERIADGAITEPKVSDGAVTESKIGAEAVTSGKLSPGVATGITRWAAVDIAGANASFFAQRGATALSKVATGQTDVTFDVPAAQANCAAFATTEGAQPNYAHVTYVGGAVRVHTRNAGGVLADRDFNVSLYCN